MFKPFQKERICDSIVSKRKLLRSHAIRIVLCKILPERHILLEKNFILCLETELKLFLTVPNVEAKIQNT